MTTKIFCPCCGRGLASVTEPEAHEAGHYCTLGPAMQGERVVGHALSWDCLCRSCGFGFVLTSDLAAPDCPLARATRPEEAERVARMIAAEDEMGVDGRYAFVAEEE